jgi:hypothetical protein
MDGNVLLIIICAVLATIGIVALIARPRRNVEQAPPPPPPVRYKATLYNNGVPVRTFRALSASASESGLHVHLEGEQLYTVMAGCYILEPVDAAPTAPRTPHSKYKATLYDAGNIIREWYVVQASPAKSGLYLLPEGAKEYTVIGGTFLLEPLT